MRPRIAHLQQAMVLDERYRLVRQLGTGSMAEVWAAQDEQESRPVAVKVVAEILAPSEQARLRFEREVQAVGSIHHPNVVALLGHGVLADGRSYLVMELVEGRSLADYLEEHPRLGAFSTLALAVQILDGLHAAHELGIIHRDIKPANIFLARLPTGRRQVKILDFGVSLILDLSQDPEERLTRTGAILGSPRYMSWEMARGATEIDARSDIFGVGAVMYHALTGAPPFDGATLGEIMTQIADHSIPSLREARPDIPESLVACVDRALAHEPADRYASAREMREGVQAELLLVQPGAGDSYSGEVSTGFRGPRGP